MNKKYLWPILLLLISVPVQAKEAEWKQFIRPYIEKYLGVEIANKYLGKIEKTLALPPLPEIKKDARSTKVYDKKRKEKKLDLELETNLNQSYVEELFSAVKQRKGTRQETFKWLNVMSQGASREGVYRAFILDDDYNALENYDKLISDRGIDFSLNFLEVYIGITVNKSTMERMNFYSVKRLTAEKALELIDSFENSKELHQWYAVMSADFSKKYGILWENKVRKDKNPFRHLHWAKQAPSQHLRSEVIIKIHQIFNYLQQ